MLKHNKCTYNIPYLPAKRIGTMQKNVECKRLIQSFYIKPFKMFKNLSCSNKNALWILRLKSAETKILLPKLQILQIYKLINAKLLVNNKKIDGLKWLDYGLWLPAQVTFWSTSKFNWLFLVPDRSCKNIMNLKKILYF